jgi:hypothetical protein
MKDPCPNCNEIGFFDGRSCSDCNYGHTRPRVIRVTAEEKNRIESEKKLQQDNILRYRRELQDLPETKFWSWKRVESVAELCAMMKLPDAKSWFKKKNEVQNG